LIEENIFDRNGWDHRIGRSDATIFAHNVYIQRSCNDVVFRGNISMRASSHGVQLRPGGIAEENVFIQNPIGLLFANARQEQARPTDRVHDNLVLEGIALEPGEARGWGIHIQDVLQVTVSDNIVANSLTPDSGWGISMSGRSDDFVNSTVITNNIVDDFGDAMFINPALVNEATITGNILSTNERAKSVIFYRSDNDGGIEYGGNYYRHTNDNEPFALGSNELTINEWQAEYDPQGGEMLSQFLDEGRSVADYARSLGLADEEAFFEALRQQRRGNWDQRLTSDAIRAYFREAFTLTNAG
ncbi:MAG: hypothetical protein AAGF47_03400, partial [Planctomycetota bacterium]